MCNVPVSMKEKSSLRCCHGEPVVSQEERWEARQKFIGNLMAYKTGGKTRSLDTLKAKSGAIIFEHAQPILGPGMSIQKLEGRDMEDN